MCKVHTPRVAARLTRTTLADAVNTVTTVQFWFMSNGFRKVGQMTKFSTIYANLAPIFVMASLCYGVVLKVHESSTWSKTSPLILLIGYMECMMASIALIITNASMQVSKGRYASLIREFEEIDNRLIREFGADMNCHKTVRKTLILTVVFIGYYVASVIGLIIQLAEGDYLNMLNIGVCYALIAIGPHVCGYAHMNLAELIRVRFRLLQKLVEPANLMRRDLDSTLVADERKIESAIEIYRRLFTVIGAINNIYGPSLLATMLHDFTLTTSQLFLILGTSYARSSSNYWRVIIAVMLIMFPPAYKMFSSPLYMTMSINESKKCLRMIKLLDFTYKAHKGDDVSTLVSSALMWHKHNRVHFSIGGVFSSNLGMIFGIISSMCGYLLILVQLKKQEDAIGGEYLLRWKQKLESNFEDVVKKFETL